MRFTGDGRTAFHAGYGIGYVRIPFQIVSAFSSNPPGIASVSFVSSTVENPAAGTLNVQTPRPQSLSLVNATFHPSEVQSFSAIIERDIMRGSVLQVGYVRSLGRKAQVGIDANQVCQQAHPSRATVLRLARPRRRLTITPMPKPRLPFTWPHFRRLRASIPRLERL